MDKEKAELDEILECLTSAEDYFPGRKCSEGVEDYLSNLRRGNLASNVIQGNAFNADREKVLSLRLGGMSCDEIVTQTGMESDEVAVFCSELGLPLDGSCYIDLPEGLGESVCRCPMCGGKVEQLAGLGRWRKFCSDRCRKKWFYENKTKGAVKNGE